MFSPIGVLDVLSSTTPRPARPGRSPQCRPLRAPWPRILGAGTMAMSPHRRGAATTKTGPWRRNPPGRWGSRPISSLLVVDDARASTPPRALTSAREPHRRTALGAAAGSLGRKQHISQHLAALATGRGEKCRLTPLTTPPPLHWPRAGSVPSRCRGRDLAVSPTHRAGRCQPDGHCRGRAPDRSGAGPTTGGWK